MFRRPYRDHERIVARASWSFLCLQKILPLATCGGARYGLNEAGVVKCVVKGSLGVTARQAEPSLLSPDFQAEASILLRYTTADVGREYGTKCVFPRTPT
jgi:hypothetical protein